MINKIIIFLIFPFCCFSQDINLSSMLIPKELTENANSVVRNQKIEIEIPSQKLMIIKKSKTITVLNSKGINNIDAIEYYDKSTKVKSIEAIVYDSFGKEIKKIKRKDFIDQSVADGFSVYSDDRKLYLNYTPIQYPFTIVYNCEIETSNTAFIPTWFPVDDYYESVQNSTITIKYSADLGFKYKERNFNRFNIKKIEGLNTITFNTENLKAIKFEEYSPSFKKINPSVLFGLNTFFLAGIDGNATTWEEFGKWRYKSLLSDNEEVSIETQTAVKKMVENIDSPLEKAKKIYEYVQNKTRYVSIQVGIGGWKPMLATDVDRLGYGDCKALTNYTRVLLKSVGVDSYYTVVYGDRRIESFENDFVSMQGNHIILAIPVNDKYTYLECTSQTSPFGFNGDFTDDRYALIVKPEGGEIIKTKEYTENENLKSVKGYYEVKDNGAISGKIKVISTGIQYSNESIKERLNREDLIASYNSNFSVINNLRIKEVKFNNNKNNLEFIEEIEFGAESYAQNLNGKLIFALNATNHETNVPKKYKVREFPFEIQRGYTDEDIIEIILPSGYTIEAMPNGVELDSEFGYYKIDFKLIDSSKIVCNRKYILKKGFYESEKYEAFRKFKETIAKNDNSKIILTKS